VIRRRTPSETGTLVTQQCQQEQQDRRPWEEPSGWRETLPGYSYLTGSVLDKPIYRSLVLNATARSLWDNTAVIKVPLSNRRHYIERSLVIHAISVGWDEGAEQWQQLSNCRALVRAWRQFRGYSDDPDYVVLLGVGFRYTAVARAGYAARKQQERGDRKRTRITAWVRIVGSG